MIYENTVKLSTVLGVTESSLHDSLWDSKVDGTNSNTVIFFTRDEVMKSLSQMLNDFSTDMMRSFDKSDMETFNITTTAIHELSGYTLLINESTAETFYIDME